MDDFDRFMAQVQQLMQQFYTNMEAQSGWRQRFEKLYKDSLADMEKLLAAMDEQSKARTSRIRLVIGLGLTSAILGVLALWRSASLEVGFLQTLLVATGGALIAFCLVSLILEKLVEIPSKEERKQKKLVSLHRSTNKELTAIGNDLLDKTRKLEEETAEKLREMRKLAFPDES